MIRLTIALVLLALLSAAVPTQADYCLVHNSSGDQVCASHPLVGGSDDCDGYCFGSDGGTRACVDKTHYYVDGCYGP